MRSNQNELTAVITDKDGAIEYIDCNSMESTAIGVSLLGIIEGSFKAYDEQLAHIPPHKQVRLKKKVI